MNDRRFPAMAGSVLRHAMGPLAALTLSWWVVHHGSMVLWAQCVVPLISVQLAVHVAQWGQRDLLLRTLRSGDTDGAALWRDNLWTRLPIALPVLLVPLFFSDASKGLLLLWGIAAMLAGSFEPLIVRDKRFTPAALVDLAAITVQLLLLASAPLLTLDVVVRSFAVAQGVRALGCWWACGTPVPWPAHFRPHVHLREAIPFVAIGLGGLLATRVDVYAVTALLHDDRVGRYQVIAALLVQLQVLPGLIARPFTTGLMRMDREALLRLARRSLRWGLLLSIPQTLIAAAVLNRGFAITVDPLLLIAGALVILPAFGYVPLFPYLYGIHRERQVMLLSFMATAIIAIGAWALVPVIGLHGALVASAAGQWSQLIGSFLLIRNPKTITHATA